MISESCEPAEFVHAAKAWDWLRLEAEIEQEVVAAELAKERMRLRLAPAPRTCHAYLLFLRQLSHWLQTGAFPRQGRRRSRQLIAEVAERLAAKGQVDRSAVDALRAD